MLKAISKRKLDEIEIQAKLHGAEFTRPPEIGIENSEKISVEKIREATARALERKGYGKGQRTTN